MLVGICNRENSICIAAAAEHYRRTNLPANGQGNNICERNYHYLCTNMDESIHCLCLKTVDGKFGKKWVLLDLPRFHLRSFLPPSEFECDWIPVVSNKLLTCLNTTCEHIIISTI